MNLCFALIGALLVVSQNIAAEGAICMNYYVSSPVCSPSRASLLSGLYPVATGVAVNGLYMSDDVQTFAHVLEAKGYAIIRATLTDELNKQMKAFGERVLRKSVPLKHL